MDAIDFRLALLGLVLNQPDYSARIILRTTSPNRGGLGDVSFQGREPASWGVTNTDVVHLKVRRCHFLAFVSPQVTRVVAHGIFSTSTLSFVSSQSLSLNGDHLRS